MARYSAIVQDHFNNPRHAGRLAEADATVTVTNPVCGDVLSLWVKVTNDRIAEVSFQAQGCPAAIAAGSMTTVLMEGRRLDELPSITNDIVAAALGGLPGDKRHCSVLAEEALVALHATLAGL